MCCLKYENDEYEEAREQMPDIGAVITTPDGSGKVVGMNILERVLQVELSEQQRILDYTLEEILQHEKSSVQ
jgi:cell fate regulator YaaT (PSP1 superfamily)